MEIDADKLEKLFEEKYNQIWSSRDRLFSEEAGRELWVNYCDEHDIFMLHPEWLRDTLNEGLKGRVCIQNCEENYHENVSPWLLVPRKFAEKALILGGLP